MTDTRRKQRRRPDTAPIVLALLALGGLSLRWLDAPSGVVAAAQALWPWGALLTVMVAAACSRRLRNLLLFLPALALVTLGAVAHFSATAPRPAVAQFTVYSANVEFSRADLGALVTASRRADIVVLAEADEAYVRRYQQARPELTARTARAADGASGTTILSRFPLTELRVPDTGMEGHQQPAARVATPGGTVVVRGVHTMSPLHGATVWHRELVDLRTWAREQRDPVVLAGDFNATVDHPAFARLRETAPEAGVHGWPFTWPAPWGVARLDHVLTRGLLEAGGGTDVIAGTDHRAVWVPLALPER